MVLAKGLLIGESDESLCSKSFNCCTTPPRSQNPTKEPVPYHKPGLPLNAFCLLK